MDATFDILGWMESNMRLRSLGRGGDHHREIKADCPFCGGSEKLWVNRDTSKWVCYKCGVGGGPVHLVRQVLGIGWTEAKRIVVGDGTPVSQPLSAVVRKYLDAERRYQSGDVQKDDPPAVALPDEYIPCWDPQTRMIRIPEYLRSRGIGVRMSQVYGLGYCLSGPYAGRVICPATVGGVLRTFQARTMIDSEPKYRNPPDNARSQVFWGYDQAVGAKTWVGVEGSFDVMGVVRAGLTAVGGMGKRFTPFHGASLATAGVERFIFLMDPDAKSDVLASAMVVSEWVPEVLQAHLPTQYDPGNAPAECIREAVAKAGPLKRFWPDMLEWGSKRKYSLDRVRFSRP